MNNGQSRGSIHSMEEEYVEHPMRVSSLPNVPSTGSVGGRGNSVGGGGGGGTTTTVTMVIVDVVSKYEGKEMMDLVREALPGKSKDKWEQVVKRLEDIDIDCVEDIQAVAETTASPERFRAWLQEKNLPDVTSMRLAKMFFTRQV